MQSSHVENRARVEWLPFTAEVRQGCVIARWLFIVYMNGVVREQDVNTYDAWQIDGTGGCKRSEV